MTCPSWDSAYIDGGESGCERHASSVVWSGGIRGDRVYCLAKMVDMRCIANVQFQNPMRMVIGYYSKTR